MEFSLRRLWIKKPVRNSIIAPGRFTPKSSRRSRSAGKYTRCRWTSRSFHSCDSFNGRDVLSNARRVSRSRDLPRAFPVFFFFYYSCYRRAFYYYIVFTHCQRVWRHVPLLSNRLKQAQCAPRHFVLLHHGNCWVRGQNSDAEIILY